MGIVSSNITNVIHYIPLTEIIYLWTLNKRVHKAAIVVLHSRYKFPLHNYLLNRPFYQYLLANLPFLQPQNTDKEVWEGYINLKFRKLDTDLSSTFCKVLVIQNTEDLSNITFGAVESFLILESPEMDKEDLTTRLPTIINNKSLVKIKLESCQSICIDLAQFPCIRKLNISRSTNVLVYSVKNIETLYLNGTDYFPEAYLLRKAVLKNMNLSKHVAISLAFQTRLLSLSLLYTSFDTFILPKSLVCITLCNNRWKESCQHKLDLCSLKLRTFYMESSKFDLNKVAAMKKLKKLAVYLPNKSKMQKIMNFFSFPIKLPVLSVKSIVLNTTLAEKVCESPDSFAHVKNVRIDCSSEEVEYVVLALNNLGDLETLEMNIISVVCKLVELMEPRKVKTFILGNCIIEWKSIFEFMERNKVENFFYTETIANEEIAKMQKEIPGLRRIKKIKN